MEDAGMKTLLAEEAQPDATFQNPRQCPSPVSRKGHHLRQHRQRLGLMRGTVGILNMEMNMTRAMILGMWTRTEWSLQTIDILVDSTLARAVRKNRRKQVSSRLWTYPHPLACLLCHHLRKSRKTGLAREDSGT